jgi:signal transduction histidine kinase
MMRNRPGLMLLGGFGGLLFIMAAAQTGALLMLNGLRSSSASLQQGFLSQNHRLEQIRSHIYLSGTYARDALLAPEPSAAEAQLSALKSLRREDRAALDSYSASMEVEERAAFWNLLSEIEAYWNVLERTFRWTPAERDKYRYRFFYEEVVPRRTAMLQIADRIETMNARALKEGNERLDALFGRLQLGLLAIVAVTLVGGTSLAGLTVYQILRLEGEVRRRLEESIQARASLQDLSAKLLRAQEDERRALSRELHDEVGQAFSTILMELENMLELSQDPATRSRLVPIRGLAEQGVNETRNMALLLRPSMLDDFGLVPALSWQARESAKRTGLQVRVSSAEVSDSLPEEHKTCIFRVVQEALNNCARHAQAKSVEIVVGSQGDRIVLRVQDDGCGFDARRVRGLGLLGMEERVRHLGGEFRVDSNPGRGTRVNVWLPLAGVQANEGNGHAEDPTV